MYFFSTKSISIFIGMVSTLLVLIFTPAVYCQYNTILKYSRLREDTDTDNVSERDFPSQMTRVTSISNLMAQLRQ